MYSKLKRPLLVSLGAVAAIGLIAGAATAIGGKTSKVDATSATTIDDVFTVTSFKPAKGDSYGSTPNLVGESGAVYKAYSRYGDSGDIQLRSSDSQSGIVVTSSSSKLVGISVEWSSSVKDSWELSLYTSSEPFNDTKDLYQGKTADYTLNKSTNSISFDAASQPSYIGVRSRNGTVYLKSITFTWVVQAVGTLESIEVDTTNAKLDYYVGDSLDWSGLSITAFDTEGSELPLTAFSNGVSIDPAHGTTATEVGEFDATVSYTSGDITKSSTFKYRVTAPTSTAFYKVDPSSIENILLGSKGILAYGSMVSGALEGKILSAVSLELDGESDVSSLDEITLFENSGAAPFTIGLGYLDETLSFYFENDYQPGYLNAAGEKNLSIVSERTSDFRDTTSFAVSASADTEGALSIKSNTTTPYYLRYNSSSPRFTLYKSGQNDPFMFVSTPTADEQVHELAAYIMAWEDTNQCVTHYWTAKDAFFNNLDENAKEIFKNTNGDASEEADIVAQAKARYDAWAINRGDYETRFDGNAPSGAAIVKDDANDDMGIYVGALAIVLAGLGVGSAVIIKKRKSRI